MKMYGYLISGEEGEGQEIGLIGTILPFTRSTHTHTHFS